jgi:hypothetical protein
VVSALKRRRFSELGNGFKIGPIFSQFARPRRRDFNHLAGAGLLRGQSGTSQGPFFNEQSNGNELAERDARHGL